MIQFLIKKTISLMGKVYVFLDKRVKHDTSPILGTVIDYDLQDKSRKELCNHIEDKFKWERDSFWNLESTQKIRLCCQTARDMEHKHEKIIRLLTQTYDSQVIGENQKYSDTFRKSNRGQGEE